MLIGTKDCFCLQLPFEKTPLQQKQTSSPSQEWSQLTSSQALTLGWERERDCFEQDLSSPAVLSHLLLNLRLKIQGHKGKKTTINWVKLIERIFSPTVWLEHDCLRLSTIHNVGPPSYVIIQMFLHGMQFFFQASAFVIECVPKDGSAN